MTAPTSQAPTSVAFPRATARTRRQPLSSRRVRNLIRIGQVWRDRYGSRLTVCQCHRKDGQVLIHGYVSFETLGRYFEPVGGGR